MVSFYHTIEHLLSTTRCAFRQDLGKRHCMAFPRPRYHMTLVHKYPPSCCSSESLSYCGFLKTGSALIWVGAPKSPLCLLAFFPEHLQKDSHCILHQPSSLNSQSHAILKIFQRNQETIQNNTKYCLNKKELTPIGKQEGNKLEFMTLGYLINNVSY